MYYLIGNYSKLPTRNLILFHDWMKYKDQFKCHYNFNLLFNEQSSFVTIHDVLVC